MSKKPQISATSRIVPPNDWNPVLQGKCRAESRKLALNRSTEFIARCVKHGHTLFDTESGACLSCLAEPSTLPARAHYMNAYAVSYPAVCAAHGVAQHDIRTNRCLRCFTAAGRPRVQGDRNEARMAARHSGATSYPGICAIHGEVPHHTIRGKCLSCFNSMGYPRKGAR